MLVVPFHEVSGVSSGSMLLNDVQVNFATQQLLNVVEACGHQAETKSMDLKICWQAHQQQQFG
jgi:hypothetical protein